MSLSLPESLSCRRSRAAAASLLAACALACVISTLTACSKSEQQAETKVPQPSSPTAAPLAADPAPPIDPCALLTSEEIAAIQGEALVGTKPSTNQANGLAMYDCFYTLPTFTNSISLSVTQAGPAAGARDPRQSWEEMLSAANAKASEKTGPPQMVEGAGEQAFWTGNERMGALYVLKGSRYLRISVGGPGDQAAKIEKCRALAEAAFKRL